MEWVVTTGKTVEEATEAALDQLGVDEQDAEIEVVQEPQKGLFGRLRAEAQVKARVRPTAPRPKVDRRERRRGDRRGRDGDRGRAKKGATREAVGATAGGSGRGATPTTTRRDEQGGGGAEPGTSTADRPVAGQAGADGPSSSRRRRRGRGPRTAEGATVSESTQWAERSGEVEPDLEAQQAAVEEFLRDLLVAFGRPDATVSVTVSEEDSAIEAAVEGTELGLLVGQKGVTLQAVQELVRSMVQRRFVGQAHARVRIDVAGYRARRKVALERFARDVAESVKSSGVAKALDPMGSADRKVVHDAVNDIEGVTTVSEGEDAARRVVIRPG
ncbi:MAG TPA: RNA-binding cell elongation regulator Jag/EloR [Acidimicrobiales bacterium]|nr:RNA-binding cell elongation regulator Jag/EloR [Acidimicrobiales bacterium]